MLCYTSLVFRLGPSMKVFQVALALMLLRPVSVSAEDLIPPIAVQFESLRAHDDIKNIIVGNSNKHYFLSCSVKAAGCITPVPHKDYLLFDKNTHWKMPGATNFINLAFIQDWTAAYTTGENVGLVGDRGAADLGIFLLNSTQQDAIFQDGPIVYGTGMSEVDRIKAWKYFFLLMVEAATRQQGADATAVKLARRCLPGQDSCVIALDAQLTGMGGIQEPRKALVLVETDAQDASKQRSRMVCYWLAEGARVCRDWDTGRLVTDFGDEEPGAIGH